MRITRLAALVGLIVCTLGLAAAERPKPKTYTVTIEGLEASVAPPEGASGGPGAKLTVGKLELKGVSDQGNGLFEVETGTYSDFKLDVGAEGQGFLPGGVL